MSDLPPDAPTNVQPTNAQLLHAFLIGRDVPCPRCGYNLRDATGDVCVECGTTVRLGIQPTEPVLRAWIATLVATSLSAGIGLLFLAIAVGQSRMPPEELWWIMFASWASIPIALAIATGRRRFLRWPATAQWAAAVGFAALLVAMFIGLMALR